MNQIRIKGKHSCSGFWLFCMDNDWSEPEASPYWKNATQQLKTQYKEEAKAVKKRGVWPYIRPKKPYMDGSKSFFLAFFLFSFLFSPTPLFCCFLFFVNVFIFFIFLGYPQYSRNQRRIGGWSGYGQKWRVLVARERYPKTGMRRNSLWITTTMRNELSYHPLHPSLRISSLWVVLLFIFIGFLDRYRKNNKV